MSLPNPPYAAATDGAAAPAQSTPDHVKFDKFGPAKGARDTLQTLNIRARA